MTRIDEYERGKRDGIRQAVTWLYHRARDPKGNVLRKPRALAPLTK